MLTCPSSFVFVSSTKQGGNSTLGEHRLCQKIFLGKVVLVVRSIVAANSDVLKRDKEMIPIAKGHQLNSAIVTALATADSCL